MHVKKYKLGKTLLRHGASAIALTVLSLTANIPVVEASDPTAADDAVSTSSPPPPTTPRKIGTRPTGVPDDYVITPNGYFHPSCLYEIADTEHVLADGSIVRADGTIRAQELCEYAYYTSLGERIEPSQRTVAQQNPQYGLPARSPNPVPHKSQPAPANYVAYSSTEPADQYGPFDVLQVSAHWNVPSPPAVDQGQVVYFFPGLERANDQASGILQPVLKWFNGSWTISSWNCCPNGVQEHSSVVQVSSSDSISGQIAQVHTSSARPDPNGYFQVVTADDQTGQRTVLNTNDGTATNNYSSYYGFVIGGALEAYNISSCQMYPASGQVFFSNIKISGDEGRGQFDWAPPNGWSLGRTPETPDCNFNVSATANQSSVSSTTSITFSTSLLSPATSSVLISTVLD